MFVNSAWTNGLGVKLLAHRRSRISHSLDCPQQFVFRNAQMLGPMFYSTLMVEGDLASVGSERFANPNHVILSIE